MDMRVQLCGYEGAVVLIMRVQLCGYEDAVVWIRGCS